MSKRRFMALTAVAAIAIGILAATPTGAATTTARSTSDVVWFADQATPVGTSQLVRTPSGVIGTVRTTVAPKEALTLWWVVFNNPEGCSDPCGEDDIFVDGDPAKGVNLDGVAAADIVAGYASGTVANNQGKAVMTARLHTGDDVDEVLFGETPVLKSSAEAEIHLVARSHGPAVPDLVADQTGSYAGGCEVFLNPPSIPSAEGECADIQFAIHNP